MKTRLLGQGDKTEVIKMDNFQLRQSKSQKEIVFLDEERQLRKVRVLSSNGGSKTHDYLQEFLDHLVPPKCRLLCSPFQIYPHLSGYKASHTLFRGDYDCPLTVEKREEKEQFANLDGAWQSLGAQSGVGLDDLGMLCRQQPIRKKKEKKEKSQPRWFHCGILPSIQRICILHKLFQKTEESSQLTL